MVVRPIRPNKDAAAASRHRVSTHPPDEHLKRSQAEHGSWHRHAALLACSIFAPGIWLGRVMPAMPSERPPAKRSGSTATSGRFLNGFCRFLMLGLGLGSVMRASSSQKWKNPARWPGLGFSNLVLIAQLYKDKLLINPHTPNGVNPLLSPFAPVLRPKLGFWHS